MKLGCIDSAFNQAGKGREFGLRTIKEIGFDVVDLFIDPLDAERDEIDMIRRVCAELELPIVSVCCVAVGLIDLNPSVQRFHVDRVSGCDSSVSESIASSSTSAWSPASITSRMAARGPARARPRVESAPASRANPAAIAIMLSTPIGPARVRRVAPPTTPPRRAAVNSSGNNLRA